MSLNIGDYTERFGLDFEIQYRAELIRYELMEDSPAWTDSGSRVLTAAAVWVASERSIPLREISSFAQVDWSAILTLAGVAY